MKSKHRRSKRLTKIRIGGELYQVAVLMVTDRDHFGRPLVARFVHEEQTVDIAELSARNPDGPAAEFITVFANRDTWGPP